MSGSGSSDSCIDTRPSDLSERLTRIVTTFYTTARIGAEGLTDGGGPFGFDVTKALLLDAIIETGGVRTFVETGSFVGDTSAYIARMYPSLSIQTCELDDRWWAIASHRLRPYGNVTLHHDDSGSYLRKLDLDPGSTLFYLDAHWDAERWPLAAELEAVGDALVVIDDFDVDHERYAYDQYNGIRCDRSLVRSVRPDLASSIFRPNPYYRWPVPCLQVGRRSGLGVIIPNMRVAHQLTGEGLIEQFS